MRDAALKFLHFRCVVVRAVDILALVVQLFYHPSKGHFSTLVCGEIEHNCGANHHHTARPNAVVWQFWQRPKPPANLADHIFAIF
jgi:hypothetical protein